MSGRRIFFDSLLIGRGFLTTSYVSVPEFMFRLELGQTDDMTIYDQLLILFEFCLDISFALCWIFFLCCLLNNSNAMIDLLHSP